jgi:Fe-Mn family superoxide dismutase
MFDLPDLPYDADALAPVISQTTLRTHHDKHHAAYVKTVNEILAQTGAPPSPLEAVIALARTEGRTKLFNNAAQAWNHSFFWRSMSPRRQAPAGAFAQALAAEFGDLDGLKAAFVKEGAGHFASGWVWLAAEDGRLRVISTHDAETLADTEAPTPLLVCDLWEHAYYLDHRQDRAGFLQAWFDALPDWAFAQAQLLAAQGKGVPWRHPPPRPA